MKAEIPASDVAAAGTYNVTVFYSGVSGGTSAARPFTVKMPSITSLSPGSVPAGNAAFTLTITGTNFLPASTVRWNDVNLVTTYVSPTQLKAEIPASDVTAAGTYSVTVFNSAASGGTSAARPFYVRLVPTITTITPASAPAGSSDLTLTVDGTNFLPTSTVRWNNTDRGTTYVSPTRLTASITAADLAASGAKMVTVTNPGVLGGSSNQKAFYVQLIPVISALTPPSAVHGGSAFILTIDGTNFLSTSQVRWNGVIRTTTYVSPTRLTAAITAADIMSVGQKSVTVFTPGSAGGTSSPKTFMVT